MSLWASTSSKLYQKQKPLRESVGDEIRSRIYSGGFPPGYRLAERDLADMFEVPRLPVREAIRVLQHMLEPLIARRHRLFRQVPDVEQLGAEHTALCDATGAGDADAEHTALTGPRPDVTLRKSSPVTCGPAGSDHCRTTVFARCRSSPGRPTVLFHLIVLRAGQFRSSGASGTDPSPDGGAPTMDDTSHNDRNQYGQQPGYPAGGSAEGENHKRNSIILGVIGLFVAGIILGPLALWQAGKAQALGVPATAGKVLGWIDLVAGILLLFMFVL